jgi:hypothetical protein
MTIAETAIKRVTNWINVLGDSDGSNTAGAPANEGQAGAKLIVRTPALMLCHNKQLRQGRDR